MSRIFLMVMVVCLSTTPLWPEQLERYIAIDNVCAWPNFTELEDGSLVATIFNKPHHGKGEGDVECWATTDGGHFWELRGTPTAHKPGTVRMNVAAGRAHDGSLIVLNSGWTGGANFRERILDPQVVWMLRVQSRSLSAMGMPVRGGTSFAFRRLLSAARAISRAVSS